LNDHETFHKTTSHFFINQSSQKIVNFPSDNTFWFCIGQVCAGKDVG
jgi:hypothetical protein